MSTHAVYQKVNLISWQLIVQMEKKVKKNPRALGETSLASLCALLDVAKNLHQDHRRETMAILVHAKGGRLVNGHQKLRLYCIYL
jgi:hypothetical protein